VSIPASSALILERTIKASSNVEKVSKVNDYTLAILMGLVISASLGLLFFNKKKFRNKKKN